MTYFGMNLKRDKCEIQQKHKDITFWKRTFRKHKTQQDKMLFWSCHPEWHNVKDLTACAVIFWNHLQLVKQM